MRNHAVMQAGPDGAITSRSMLILAMCPLEPLTPSANTIRHSPLPATLPLQIDLLCGTCWPTR